MQLKSNRHCPLQTKRLENKHRFQQYSNVLLFHMFQLIGALYVANTWDASYIEPYWLAKNYVRLCNYGLLVYYLALLC